MTLRMRGRLRALIGDQEAAYLQQLITGPDFVGSKNALQQLCQRYRSGKRLRNEQLMRRILLGSLDHPDAKVVRWTLNSLAFLATSEDVDAILRTIGKHRLNPDILGAGVAAMASLRDLDQLREELAAIDLPLQGAALFAAAQHLQGLEPDLRKERVSVDSENYGDLRLATVLVGINKAPENLFESNYENAEMLGRLNQHPDPLTAQYSIWALTERTDLGLSDLNVPLSDITCQRENIRAYIYQLVAEDTLFASQEIDLLREGIQDVTEVRDHLARGLRNTYFEQLPDLTMTWYFNEDDDKTRRRIVEHIAIHSERDDSYFEFARELVRSNGLASLELAQMQASAGKRLAHEMKMFEYQLFAIDMNGGVVVTNNKYEIGNINASAVAFEGNATNFGDTNITVAQAAQQARDISSLLLRDLEAAAASVPQEVRVALEEASSTPKKSNMSRILRWLKTGAVVSGAALTAVGGVPGAVQAIEIALPLLPS